MKKIITIQIYLQDEQTIDHITYYDNELINEIEICEGHEKLMQTITEAYAKAPYFRNTISIMEVIFQYPETNLAFFLEFSIRKVCNYIGINTEIIMSGGIEKNNTLRSQEKVLDICVRQKSDHYINAIGGKALYDAAAFQKRGIKLQFLDSKPFVYNQFSNSFIPSMSIIDVLMFNSPQCIHEQLNQYNLL